MSHAAAQKSEFQNRLKRIAAGGPNTLGQVYVGITGEDGPQKVYRERAPFLSVLKSVILFPFAVAGAFTIGLIAVIVARFIRVMAYGGVLAGENADMLMIIDAGIALVAASLLRWMFRFQGRGMGWVSAVGIVAMVCLMHNLVHMEPDIFAIAFPAEWVEGVLRTTQIDTVLVRGVFFPIPYPG